MLHSFRRMFVIYKGYRLRLIFSQVLLMISAAAMLMVASLNQRLINQGIQAENADVIVSTGITMVVLALIGGGCLAGTAAFAVFFSQGTAYIIRTEVYKKIQTFSFGNFDRYRTGNLMVRLNADVLNIQNAVMYSVILLLYAPFMILIAFVFASITTSSLIWLMIVVAVMVLVLMAFIVPQMFKAYDERQNRLDDLNNTLQENLSGARVVKAFVREKLENERFERRAEAMRQPAFAATFRVALLSPLLAGIAQISTAFAVWVGGTQVLDQSGLTVGQVTTFMQYLSLVVTPLALMAVVIPFILRGDASAGRIFQVIDAEPAIEDSPEAEPPDPTQIKGRLVFDNVTFAFRRPDGELDPPALKNINLSQGQRQMITIARAMVANPKMLILDEATSNVDTRTEKLIQEGLRRLMEGKTSFVIAHRLSTIQHAHHIMAVNGGEIEEFGPHEELMAKKGFYYNLYMSQFKGKLPGSAQVDMSQFVST